MKIDDATADSNVTGVEKIPVSDGGLPRVVTVQSVGDYVLSEILALVTGEESDALGSDSLVGSRSDRLTTFSASKIVALALAGVWNGASATAIDAATVPLTSGATKGEIDLSALSTYLKTKIGTDLLSLSGLSDVTVLADADLCLVSQSGTAKKATWAQFVSAMDASIADYVTAQTAVTEPADANLIPIIYGGFLRKVTVAVLKSILGTVGFMGASSTENYVPQWSSGQKVLKDGLPVITTIRDSATASNVALASERLVRSAVGFVGHVQLRPSDFMSLNLKFLNEFVVCAFPYDSAVEFETILRMPDDWDGGVFRFRAVWEAEAGATVGQNVKFYVGFRAIVDGVLKDGADTASDSVIDSVSAGVGYVETSPVSSDLTITTSRLLGITVTRDITYDGGGGGVVGGDVSLMLLEIEYSKGASQEAW